MAQPYVGEIRMFAGNFAPVGWMLCLGQLMPISEYTALFNAIGTTYGGDGTTTFALPDLRGRAPLHQGSLSGNTFNIGQKGGVENVDLTVAQIPAHTHALVASNNNATTTNPANNLLSNSGSLNLYVSSPPGMSTNPQNISPVGGSQSHDNMQPFLVINFIILVSPPPDSIFPSQS